MDAKEHFQAKDQDAAADRRLMDLKKKTDKMRENQDSKDYQVFKKVYKAEERAVDLEQITDVGWGGSPREVWRALSCPCVHTGTGDRIRVSKRVC